MATLNLSTNGPSISKSYQSVVDAPPPSGPAAASPTYGIWAVFAVQAPLINAFQQGGAQKESVLKVQSTGEGELVDLIEDFSDGKIQFGFVKVKDPNTSLPKNVLIAWCGEGVPERTKGYFTSHLAAVSKLLHGYHVQVTARSDRDLTPEAVLQKVSDASGAKYSGGDVAPQVTSTKPPVASKPVFTPTRTAGSFKPLASAAHRTVASGNNTQVDDDGWGADAPQVTRTQLQKVESAYKPTKVNIKELMTNKTATTSGPDRHDDSANSDVVRGGYQPIGKVDISAIRRQAKETGQLKDERPEIIKGSYEPIGKVDIAAIRAKAQGADVGRTPPAVSPAVTGASNTPSEPKSLGERSTAFTSSERLTSLPKPKVSGKFGASATFTGTKAPTPGGFEVSPPPATQLGSTRSFADQAGKTPAQIWAEKKAKQQGGAVTQSTGPHAPDSQDSNQQPGWKSSYSGKSWAPVQTASISKPSDHVDARADSLEAEKPHSGTVGSIRDQFAHAPPMGTSTYERSAPSPPPLDTSTKPTASRGVPIPGLPLRPAEPEEAQEEVRQPVSSPPQQARSPSPSPSSERASSPIRVAMPVGRGVADEPIAHVEQSHVIASLPTAQSHQKEEEVEKIPSHVAGGAGASQAGRGIQAIAQFDYEKAEDNEIDMQEGECITNIEMVDDDWWLGVNPRGDAGLFPRNYVELVEEGETEAAPPAPARPTAQAEPEPVPQPPQTAPEQSAGNTATALYDYEAAEDNEISFPEDAKIINIEFPDEDWWLGEFNGKQGLFPANYVRLDE
ncbi:hypothetical protein FQN57_005788 [Myotisia sp. PD_48]|nr:hypothetical protein FQN57_005788 [Myotisia sp. PD_48]